MSPLSYTLSGVSYAISGGSTLAAEIIGAEGGIPFARGTGVIRRTLIVLLLLSAATARLPAQEPARFFIERIDIRNAHRVSPEVVVAESRLREGRTYSERELSEAAARVSRAPYLLSADFSLEKGSERGKFVLVISVNETKPFFYRLDVVPILPRDLRVHVDLPANTVAAEDEGSLGFRFFLGRRGAIHFGIEGTVDQRSYTTDYTSLAAGYTRYDLFGTRAFVTLNLKKPIAAARSSVNPQLVAGIPLSINQTLTLEYDPTDVGNASSAFRQSQRIATVKWSYNTTNHPLLPTRGVLLTATPIAVWRDTNGSELLPPTYARTRYLLHDTSRGLELTATHWWELNDQDSIDAGIEAGWARTKERGFRAVIALNGRRDVESRFAILDLTFAHSFWLPERVAREGDSRFELNVRAGPSSQEYSRLVHGQFDSHVRQVALRWVRYNAWGIFRLGAGYAW